MSARDDVLDSTEAGGKIIRGGVVRTAGYVAMTLMTLISFPLITRALGVERFADYQTALSVVTVVAALTDAGMATLAIREYARVEAGERERLVQVLVGLRTVLTAVGVVAGTLVGVLLGFDDALLLGTVLAGFGVGLNVVQSTLLVPLYAQLRITAGTVLEVARQLVLVVLLVAVVVADGGVLPLLAATVPAGLVGVLATVRVLRGAGASVRPRVDLEQWRRLLRLTAPVALATSAGTVYVYLVQILTEAVADPTESGLFAAAFRVFIIAGAVPGLVVSSAFPLLARTAKHDDARFAYALERIQVTALLGGGLLALGTFALAPLIIEVVAGPDYEDAVPALRVQAWGLLASFGVAAGGFGLLSLERHRAILAANLVALVTAASLGVWLADAEGAIGASAASVAGESVLAVVSLALLARARPGSGLAAGDAARVALALAVGVGVVVALIDLPLLAAAGGTLAYGACALAVGVVPPELREALLRRASS